MVITICDCDYFCWCSALDLDIEPFVKLETRLSLLVCHVLKVAQAHIDRNKVINYP